MNTIQILLLLVTQFDWQLHQFDVKNDFLHGGLQEEIYIKIPLGCVRGA